jgi:hypothetical protein
MSSPARTVNPVPPTAAAIIFAFKNAGVPAFYDRNDCVIYAHPAAVPESRALRTEHVMVEWTPSDPAPGEARLKATAWVPDGLPDFDQVGTVYTTPEQGPLADEAAQCARAVTQWFAKPRPKARAVLLAALAEYGITPHIIYGHWGVLAEIRLEELGVGRGTLEVADRGFSLDHLADAHTGWSIFPRDERRVCLSNPIYISGDGRTTVDCATDSADAAKAIADHLTTPPAPHPRPSADR